MPSGSAEGLGPGVPGVPAVAGVPGVPTVGVRLPSGVVDGVAVSPFGVAVAGVPPLVGVRVAVRVRVGVGPVGVACWVPRFVAVGVGVGRRRWWV
jgi:hypothetical protein